MITAIWWDFEYVNQGAKSSQMGPQKGKQHLKPLVL